MNAIQAKNKVCNLVVDEITIKERAEWDGKNFRGVST